MTVKSTIASLGTALALALLMLAPGQATAENADRYIGIILGSQHIGNDNLNNVNPGLTFGSRWHAFAPGVEWHVEGGIFYNSYEEISPILMGGISTSIGNFAGGEIRVGLSVGTAYYPTLAPDLEADHGIPNAAGFIPMIGATATWRKNDWDYRITTVPAGTDTTAIFNFSIAKRY